MKLTKEQAALMNRYPDLKAARMRCLARRRTALATRGGSKKVQLERWTAKHSLRCEDPTVYVRAAELRAAGYADLFAPTNAAR
jgi:hypothetical protein